MDMRSHTLIAFAFTCLLVLCGFFVFSRHSEIEQPRRSGTAVVYQSHYEIPSQSGSISESFLISSVSVHANHEIVERSHTGLPYTTLEFEYAILDNRLVTIEDLGVAPSPGKIVFGRCHVPADASPRYIIVYHIFRDTEGFYLSGHDDSSSVRHRFKSSDDFEVMFEAEQFVSKNVFPYDVVIASGFNAER